MDSVFQYCSYWRTLVLLVACCPVGADSSTLEKGSHSARQVVNRNETTGQEDSIGGVIGGGAFRCPVPNVIYQDPLHCEYFYVCINSNPYRLQCLPGFAFDIMKGYCSPKATVATCLVDNILTGYNCPSDGFQPDKFECTKFYWCYNNSATQLDCPAGMKFDKNSKLCVLSDMATCSSILNP